MELHNNTCYMRLIKYYDKMSTYEPAQVQVALATEVSLLLY